MVKKQRAKGEGAKGEERRQTEESHLKPEIVSGDPMGSGLEPRCWSPTEKPSRKSAERRISYVVIVFPIMDYTAKP